MSTTGVELSREQVIEMNKKLRNDGFIVDVSFKRKGHYITVSPKLLGVDLDRDEGLKAFFDKHVPSNKVSFLSKSIDDKAENKAKAAHKEKKRQSLFLGDANFMTREVLNEFKESLERYKKGYFEERDKIVAQYDELVEAFKQDFQNDLVNNTLSTMEQSERDALVKAVFNKIPTKQEYHDSYKVVLKTHKITLVGELEDSEEEDALTDTIEQVTEIVAKNLSIAFDKLNTLMGHFHTNGGLNGRNRSVFTSLPAELRKRNLFNDALVDEVASKLSDFKSNRTPDYEVVEETEVLVSKIYGYALELGIEDQFDLDGAVLSESVMLDLYDLFSMEEEEEEEEELRNWVVF